MNNCVLVGRLIRKPECRTVNTANGVNTTCSFALSVQRTTKGADGFYETDLINCIVWGKQAETLARYCDKGSQVGVVGRIQVRNYDDRDGKKVYVTEIMVNTVRLMGGRDAGAPVNNPEYTAPTNNTSYSTPVNAPYPTNDYAANYSNNNVENTGYTSSENAGVNADADPFANFEDGRLDDEYPF